MSCWEFVWEFCQLICHLSMYVVRALYIVHGSGIVTTTTNGEKITLSQIPLICSKWDAISLCTQYNAYTVVQINDYCDMDFL